MPFQNGSIGTVITNNVPIDQSSFLGSGFSSNDIVNLLDPNGGSWINNSVTMVDFGGSSGAMGSSATAGIGAWLVDNFVGGGGGSAGTGGGSGLEDEEMEDE